MSYEGIEQRLCANGHLWECDSYVSVQFCSICNQESIWCNEIDQTNGGTQGEIDMDELLIKPAVFDTCNLGHQHEIAPPIYRIPTKEETEALREYHCVDCGNKMETNEFDLCVKCDV